ncbi:hypothetical protein PV08_02764 [Exophiala spinifera]|uniref:Uncharacterized protein n=1 Tax=Exophiala spinifera TaxID=91928 RepID=A0A0D1YT65_9EURO|nr:uncharacterized protein PV08_02764 [Exophiala spinifera]KIW18476.1 hypothetical protein PV08_02764 [Exophiala spinifera]
MSSVVLLCAKLVYRVTTSGLSKHQSLDAHLPRASDDSTTTISRDCDAQLEVPGSFPHSISIVESKQLSTSRISENNTEDQISRSGPTTSPLDGLLILIQTLGASVSQPLNIVIDSRIASRCFRSTLTHDHFGHGFQAGGWRWQCSQHHAPPGRQHHPLLPLFSATAGRYISGRHEPLSSGHSTTEVLNQDMILPGTEYTASGLCQDEYQQVQLEYSASGRRRDRGNIQPGNGSEQQNHQQRQDGRTNSTSGANSNNADGPSRSRSAAVTGGGSGSSGGNDDDDEGRDRDGHDPSNPTTSPSYASDSDPDSDPDADTDTDTDTDSDSDSDSHTEGGARLVPHEAFGSGPSIPRRNDSRSALIHPSTPDPGYMIQDEEDDADVDTDTDGSEFRYSDSDSESEGASDDEDNSQRQDHDRHLDYDYDYDYDYDRDRDRDRDRQRSTRPYPHRYRYQDRLGRRMAWDWTGNPQP